MSASASASPATRSGEEACAFTCAAGKKEENVMEEQTGAVRSRTGFRQTSGLLLLTDAPGLAAGRRMPVIGRRGGAVPVTLAERKSQSAIIAQAPDKRAENVSQALAGALRPCQDQVHASDLRQRQGICFSSRVFRSSSGGMFFCPSLSGLGARI